MAKGGEKQPAKGKRQQPAASPRGLKSLRPGDIAVILRAAEDILPGGRREQLAALLRGQAAGGGAAGSPVYGIYAHLAERLVLQRIDWLIHQGYLQLEGKASAPHLAFTEKGWEIAADTHAAELQEELDELLQAGKTGFDLAFLPGVNRKVSERLLERIALSQDRKYLPLLETWAVFENKKMRKRIEAVAEALAGSP